MPTPPKTYPCPRPLNHVIAAFKTMPKKYHSCKSTLKIRSFGRMKYAKFNVHPFISSPLQVQLRCMKSFWKTIFKHHTGVQPKALKTTLKITLNRMPTSSKFYLAIQSHLHAVAPSKGTPRRYHSSKSELWNEWYSRMKFKKTLFHPCITSTKKVRTFRSTPSRKALHEPYDEVQSKTLNLKP